MRVDRAFEERRTDDTANGTRGLVVMFRRLRVLPWLVFIVGRGRRRFRDNATRDFSRDRLSYVPSGFCLVRRIIFDHNLARNIRGGEAHF